ncbi:hypothetical protein [Roseateles puraquae]|uniref:hypothetical protein n=1 Tax=Roseateles puraquae TaxID=431059 RepID=UPI001186DCEE|nr:hypothetical protein [Roseateles puraquae]MDG0853367.1 hypothetical protein [Roseateles puraquae]
MRTSEGNVQVHKPNSPAFDTGTVLVTSQAFGLLQRAGVAPAELLTEHQRLIPAKAIPTDLALRLNAIQLRHRVTTRFPVLTLTPQIQITEVCVVTEPGHHQTLIRLANEFR